MRKIFPAHYKAKQMITNIVKTYTGKYRIFSFIEYIIEKLVSGTKLAVTKYEVINNV